MLPLQGLYRKRKLSFRDNNSGEFIVNRWRNKGDLMDFERRIIKKARNHGISIGETAAYMKCSWASVVKEFKD